MIFAKVGACRTDLGYSPSTPSAPGGKLRYRLRAAALKLQNLATINKTRRSEEQIAHAFPSLYSQLSGR
jgi:hypothetical protein